MQYFGFDRPSFGIKTFGFGANPDDAILALFAGGKQGVWFDPSDKSTLFQDVAGTVPVTKDGDPVALMHDKSGNGNHATQSVSTARPVYKTDGILHWLQLDGVDDNLTIQFLEPLRKSEVWFTGKSATGLNAYLLDCRLSADIYSFNTSLTGLSVGYKSTDDLFNAKSLGLGVYMLNMIAIPSQFTLTMFSRYTNAEFFKGSIYGLIITEQDTSKHSNTINYLSYKSGVSL